MEKAKRGESCELGKAPGQKVRVVRHLGSFKLLHPHQAEEIMLSSVVGSTLYPVNIWRSTLHSRSTPIDSEFQTKRCTITIHFACFSGWRRSTGDFLPNC
jgi:hypothetical protein